jgi:hypothetical protein
MPETAMSQQPLSSEPTALKNVGDAEISDALNRYFGEDTAPSFLEHLLLKLEDPFSRNVNGGFKLNGLWLGLGMLASLAILVFIYFNFMRQ